MDDTDIADTLKKLREKDPFFADGKIVSSVSTEPLGIALEAYRMFADVNALDTYIFDSARVLEEEVIHWMGELFRNPNTSGYITTGGTESNIAALYSAKKLHPERNEVIVPKSAHYSIDKAVELMGLKLVRSDIDERYKADSYSIKKKITKKTLAVVATAGTSSLGAVDSIEEINELCDDVFLHIDAAFGGFILPFIRKGELDFAKENIDSMTVDPHKLGGVPIPSGTLLFRDDSYLKNLTKSPTYIPVQTSTLSGSRSGGAIAATWATLMHYGFDGYEARAKECMKNTEFLCNEISRIKGASIVTEPDLNIVGLKLKDPVNTSNQLIEKGWKIASNKELGCIRFAVMPHITKERIEEFLEDLKIIIK